MPTPSDPEATLAPEQDPTEDTPNGQAEDTAQDTQGTIDWEDRYKKEQIFISRQAEEIKALKAKVARAASEPDEDEEDDEDDEADEPAPDRGAERLERDSWRLAEQVYGGDAISAYGKAARLLDKASTPSDYVAAFEAYYSARLEAETKRYAKQAGGTAQAQPSQPAIDSNRSDAAPRNYDAQAEAALAKGDSRGFLLAQIQRIRGER